MVIRYRGTSPKLGSCQGECPYPCNYVLGGGEEGVVDDVGLLSVFHGIGVGVKTGGSRVGGPKLCDEVLSLVSS